MHMENTFRIKGQQLDEIVIPVDTVKENFTVYVEDSIDRNEETLTGIDSWCYMLILSIWHPSGALLMKFYKYTI